MVKSYFLLDIIGKTIVAYGCTGFDRNKWIFKTIATDCAYFIFKELTGTACIAEWWDIPFFVLNAFIYLGNEIGWKAILEWIKFKLKRTDA